MKSNITLIGMPGAGKSTIGVILAKMLSFGFIDTDVLIQTIRRKSLQQILDESGYMGLRKVEEEELLKLTPKHHVIATGGSAVYSPKGMAHLKSISRTVFLDAKRDTLLSRIHNFETRGIAKAGSQSFEDLYNERRPLYLEHADITIDSDSLDQEEIAQTIARWIYTT